MTNSDFDDVISGSARLTSVSIPFWTKPGFAIPLFQSRSESNTTYVQRTDKRRRIAGFRLFTEAAHIHRVEYTRHARVGDRELFALIDLAGRAHVGTQAELSPIVKAWVHRIDSPLTKMNFARFCGDQTLAQKAAFEAVQTKTAEFSDRRNALIWFIDSVVVVDLLNTLTSHLKDRTWVDTLFERAQVAVRFDGRRISVELPPSILERQPSTSYRKDLARLLEFARFATQYEIDLKDRGRSAATPPTNNRNSAQRARFLIKEISKIPRQEERLAAIMRAVLTEGRAGFEVLNRYRDRAVFARSAIRELRKSLNPRSPANAIENAIATDIPRLMRTAFPRGRGKLLFYLADALGDSNQIADAIRSIVIKSNSTEIRQVRSRILERLNKARST